MTVLKKKFVKFPPHVYEECRFLQDCRKANNTHCQICRVILMRDRFLGEEFHEKVELKRNINPYILLIDTAGCNLDCWFCYAHEMIEKADYSRLDPVFLSPEELADCFICKMEQSRRLPKKDQDRFFSRIRITGGEPLHSTDDTILRSTDLSLTDATIDYFLHFFKELDTRIYRSVKDGTISLLPLQKYDPSMSFPTWLSTKPGRINVRFDTNGLLFSRRENATRFIRGVANRKLKNLRIEIDCSLKGAVPVEFKWAMHQALPVDENKVSQKFDIKSHIQYSGLMNILELKEDLKGNLGESFSLTIERGINNGKNNGFINFPGSLNWKVFEDLFNKELRSRGLQEIKLSDVNNPLQYAKQFGYLFGRYHSRGVGIRLQTQDEIIDYLPWDSRDKEAILKGSINRSKSKKKPFKLIFFPAEQQTYQGTEEKIVYALAAEEEISWQKPDTKGGEGSSLNLIQNMWIFTGKLENWEYSINNGIWGVKDKHKDLWDILEIDDLGFFYISKPVGGLVGCGRVIEKLYNRIPTWKDEIEKNEIIYPYKMKFNKIFATPKENWVIDCLNIKKTGIAFTHGINLVEEGRHRETLLRLIKRNWNIEV